MDYKNGKIYRIVCDITGEQYFGSTTQPLYKRLSLHKKSKRITTATPIIERGNYTIVLVEDYACENKNQLERRERFYIENNVCVNKVIPTRTSIEYYEANRERLNEYQRGYFQANKEKMQHYNRERVVCECGCILQRGHLSRHKRTAKHIEFIEENA